MREKTIYEKIAEKYNTTPGRAQPLHHTLQLFVGEALIFY